MNIEEKVKRILSDYLGIDEEKIRRETLLIDDLGIDSLNGLEIEMEIEKEFGFKEFYEVELDKIRTVDDIVRTVKDNLPDFK